MSTLMSETVEGDNANATYKQNVLRIELPKYTSRRRTAVKVDVR